MAWEYVYVHIHRRILYMFSLDRWGSFSILMSPLTNRYGRKDSALPPKPGHKRSCCFHPVPQDACSGGSQPFTKSTCFEAAGEATAWLSSQLPGRQTTSHGNEQAIRYPTPWSLQMTVAQLTPACNLRRNPTREIPRDPLPNSSPSKFLAK